MLPISDPLIAASNSSSPHSETSSLRESVRVAVNFRTVVSDEESTSSERAVRSDDDAARYDHAGAFGHRVDRVATPAMDSRPPPNQIGERCSGKTPLWVILRLVLEERLVFSLRSSQYNIMTPSIY